jgi:hypothetical protein
MTASGSIGESLGCCRRWLTAWDGLTREAGRCCGGCASLYNNPLKTDIAFVGRFASKSVLANLYDKE